MFKPLSTAYSAELAAYMDSCQGLSSVTKRDFFRMFYKAWTTSFHEQAIKKSFQVTGLSPFNPNTILQRFKKVELERPSSSESSTSILSASDWRKVERLLREIIADVWDEQSKKLSQVVHKMAVRAELAEHENQRLRSALLNEHKKRKRGKPLP